MSETLLKTLDYVDYDLNDSAQLQHYEKALSCLSNMECISISGGLREYNAYNLQDVPTFPTHKDFGYEVTLKSGSTIFDVKNLSVYVYSKLGHNGDGEWCLI